MHSTIAFNVFAVLLTLSQRGRCIPSPNDLGSDLTILINNDLLGPQSASADSGVILLTGRSRESAAADCEALGEQLWAPELKTASIQPNLDYVAYENKYPSSQQYWIAPSSAGFRAIDGKGKIAVVSPHLHLPVLCTQTAPFSNSTFQDTSSQWQVAVHSNNEYITGFRDRLSFRFLGLRYAPQPERFTYSTAYEGTGNNASATSYGTQCINIKSNKALGSEDCLFLNIWTPFLPAHGGSPTQDLKPVMFWIHGGAFTGGTGTDPTFDGANLASRGDVVMVTIDYRLTTLGFLALDDGVTNGNYGFADQINALEWVRKNIQDFGGDPNRITIFGQSAGAGSVRALLASPKSKGLFAGAIPQSNLGGGGYGTTYSQYLTIEEEMAVAGTAILEATNCSNVDCLREVPASTLANLTTVARYIVVDDNYISSTGLVLNDTGSLPDVHILSGFMRDDGVAFITVIQTDNLTTSLTADGFDAPLVEDSRLFPIPEGSNTTLDVFNVSGRVATDTIFRCIDQATTYASLVSHTFSPNQYMYQFNRSYQLRAYQPNPPLCDAPITASHPYGDPDQEYFKCHSGELYYVFGTILTMGNQLRDENDLPFEQFTLDSWASFARTFDPNPDKGFLTARGYTCTLAEIERAGRWMPTDKNNLMLRQLEWPTKNIPFGDIEQCKLLGWPIGYFL